MRIAATRQYGTDDPAIVSSLHPRSYAIFGRTDCFQALEIRASHWTAASGNAGPWIRRRKSRRLDDAACGSVRSPRPTNAEGSLGRRRANLPMFDKPLTRRAGGKSGLFRSVPWITCAYEQRPHTSGNSTIVSSLHSKRKQFRASRFQALEIQQFLDARRDCGRWNQALWK